MSYTVTKYPAGTFCWTDFSSTDRELTREFFNSLFGWTSVDMPTGEGQPDYTMFSLDGKVVAGGGPAYMEGMPSMWTSYVSVDDIDVSIARAKKLGAVITMPPMDVLDSGRMSNLIDPTGAHLALWQPKNHIGAQIVNTVGAMCWNELYTQDLEKAKEFYAGLFGWTYDVDDESGYVGIVNNGRNNGGMMALTPEMGSMPPVWIPYFTVKSLAEATAKTKELGGVVHMPEKDIGVGVIAMIAEPTGASCMIMEMSVKPDEWVE